mmetsp:Transcript_25897/g.48268  ORF Transcript_25897/g.48268 Transcript_25897/m.48268 type:complete len:202 (+) Transcript_25897:203-808(+)
MVAAFLDMMEANDDEFVPEDNHNEEALLLQNLDLDDDLPEPQPRLDNPRPPPLGALENPNPLEHWDNVLPADIVNHPVIVAFQVSNANFLVSDPRIVGNPIIFASQGFLDLTRYPIARVLGRNCRFLQGPETDPAAVSQMREAIDRGEDVSVKVLNYKYDGTTFHNNVFISGIRDPSSNQVLYYVGLQCVDDTENENAPLS